MSERHRLLAAAALGTLLCLAGNRWGLPARFHPDEKADVVAGMVAERRLLPDSYINPSLPLLLTAPVVAVHSRIAARLAEPWSDPLLVARGLAALVSGLAVLLLGLAAAAPRGGGQGALAALLLAVAPGVVNLGHFATPEAFMLAAASLVLLVARRHVEGSAPAWALGAAFGLSLATKYTAAGLLPVALAAAWLRPREPAGRADRLAWLAAGLVALLAGGLLAAAPGGALAASLRLKDARLLHSESARAFVGSLALAGLATGTLLVTGALLSAWDRSARLAERFVRREVVIIAATALCAFILGTPGALLEPRAFLSDLAFNAQTRHEYKGLVGEATSFVAYLGLAADALTLPVLVSALAGLLLVARGGRANAAGLLAALAAIGPYVLVASSGHRALRFLAPALPGAAWLAARGLVAMPTGWPRRLLATAVVARSGLAALLVVRLFYVDSRIEAEAWLRTHVPPGAAIDLITNHEGYAPRLPPGRPARIVRTLSREMAPAERFEEASRSYAAKAAEWLVLTGAFYQRFLDNPEQRPERARFFRDLLEGRGGFSVAARFRQQGWRRPEAEFLDPEIVVLRKAAARPSG